MNGNCQERWNPFKMAADPIDRIKLDLLKCSDKNIFFRNTSLVGWCFQYDLKLSYLTCLLQVFRCDDFFFSSAYILYLVQTRLKQYLDKKRCYFSKLYSRYRMIGAVANQLAFCATSRVFEPRIYVSMANIVTNM